MDKVYPAGTDLRNPDVPFLSSQYNGEPMSFPMKLFRRRTRLNRDYRKNNRFARIYGAKSAYDTMGRFRRLLCWLRFMPLAYLKATCVCIKWLATGRKVRPHSEFELFTRQNQDGSVSFSHMKYMGHIFTMYRSLADIDMGNFHILSSGDFVNNDAMNLMDNPGEPTPRLYVLPDDHI